MIRYTLSLFLLVLLSNSAFAGTGYVITSTAAASSPLSRDQIVTYKVNFGGGFNFEQHTAYDPASKKFVYLTWKSTDPDPTPTCSIWSHRTGQRIDLYLFPGVEHPLPVIPSIDAMKVCPKTGDKNFKHEVALYYD